MNKKEVRSEAFKYLAKYGKNIQTKLNNVCSKTGQYNVPSELFQKRTSRSNRALISWKVVKDNNLTIEQLNSFEGGVVVEFMNNDYFDSSNKNNPVFKYLINNIGSDDNVSAIITIRSEGGSSSSKVPRLAFDKLIANTHIRYKGCDICITKDNYQNYAIKQLQSGGKGNDKWDGFLFVSIRGGQQDTIETHHGEELTIFNPACEYANHDVCVDIDLVASYFLMRSIDKLEENHENILKMLEKTLASIKYNSSSYNGDLLKYCKSHPSIVLDDKHLTDPIQLRPINIENFKASKREADSIDFTHIEAVNKDKYYWDSEKKCILSPARPTNIFWSYHLSNMMQQDYTLDEYFAYEKERFMKRQKLLNK